MHGCTLSVRVTYGMYVTAIARYQLRRPLTRHYLRRREASAGHD
jgi:hypothetical protein